MAALDCRGVSMSALLLPALTRWGWAPPASWFSGCSMLSPAPGADATRELRQVVVGWEVPAACSSANVPGDRSSDGCAALQGNAPQRSAWPAARAGHRYWPLPVQGGEQTWTQPRHATPQRELVQDAKQGKQHELGRPCLAKHTGKAVQEHCGWGTHPSSESLALADPPWCPRPHLEPSSRPMEPDTGSKCVHGRSDPESTQGCGPAAL